MKGYNILKPMGTTNEDEDVEADVMSSRSCLDGADDNESLGFKYMAPFVVLWFVFEYYLYFSCFWL